MRVYAQNRRQFGDHVDRRAVNTTLERTHIRSIDLCLVRQCFLRELAAHPQPAQIQGEDLSYFHSREATVLMGILLRSILDKLH